MAQKTEDDGMGCLIFLALLFMLIGGAFMWGPQVFFWVGAIILGFILVAAVL